MPMRRDCRHYETRTYGSGDTVHRCRLDLAPDAPWRCPSDCPKFAIRSFDVGWTQGSLAGQAAPANPPGWTPTPPHCWTRPRTSSTRSAPRHSRR